MVFHNLWKEKKANCAQSAKIVRKYKTFFERVVENHVENVDKNNDPFPHESVEKEKQRATSLFGDFWKPKIGIFTIIF